jgi:hypothetical protein
MEIKKLSVELNGSCSDCQRGTLRKNGIGMDYPYNYTYHVKVGPIVFRVCEDCRKKLIGVLIESGASNANK